MSGLLPIVNERDVVIGAKTREACGPGDITRVSGLFLYNSDREILIARRDLTKQYDPGKWSLAVAGTVEVGETFLSNILKETQEEIGLLLQPDEVQELWYGLFRSTHQFFYRQYAVKKDISLVELRPQPGEVTKLRLIPAHEFFQWVETKPEDFVTSMPRVVPIIREALGW